MNSQLSKEIDFEILFRNLDHVLFCEIFWKTFHLWSAVIGQSASVYKHRMKPRRCWLSKVYFQCERGLNVVRLLTLLQTYFILYLRLVVLTTVFPPLRLSKKSRDIRLCTHSRQIT